MSDQPEEPVLIFPRAVLVDEEDRIYPVYVGVRTDERNDVRCVARTMGPVLDVIIPFFHVSVSKRVGVAATEKEAR